MYREILKRVGVVLIVVGAIDIMWMIYCFANKISYSSSFNIFAVVAGIFLMRGSLRTASSIRWFAAFLLAVFATILVILPYLQPIDLTLTQIKLNPFWFLSISTFMIFTAVFLSWLIKELGKAVVLEAMAKEGLKVGNIKFAFVAGVLFVVAIAVLSNVLVNSE